MRPTIHTWAMNIVKENAKRSTCLRRQVGCVLLNKRNHILATGYNGVAAGLPHCNDVEYTTGRHPFACSGAESPSGTNLDGCEAIHAEQNALLQCRDVYEIQSCYVTCSPCMTCTKLLLNTSCENIYFMQDYTHTEAMELWTKAGRGWFLIPNMEGSDD